MSPVGLELIARAAAKLPQGSQIILALDHDEGGESLAEEIRTRLYPEVIDEGPCERSDATGAEKTGMML